MLYTAKTQVTYAEILRNPGDTFEVSDADAEKFGWNKANDTVEPVKTPETPAPAEVPAPAPETPADAPVSPASDTGEYPQTPEQPKPADAETATGEGNTNQA